MSHLQVFWTTEESRLANQVERFEGQLVMGLEVAAGSDRSARQLSLLCTPAVKGVVADVPWIRIESNASPIAGTSASRLKLDVERLECEAQYLSHLRLGDEMLHLYVEVVKEGSGLATSLGGERLLLCGSGHGNPEGCSFCIDCGASLAAAPRAMFCRDCERWYGVGQEVCPHCYPQPLVLIPCPACRKKNRQGDLWCVYCAGRIA